MQIQPSGALACMLVGTECRKYSINHNSQRSFSEQRCETFTETYIRKRSRKRKREKERREKKREKERNLEYIDVAFRNKRHLFGK